jgi:PEP-CTERM motif
MQKHKLTDLAVIGATLYASLAPTISSAATLINVAQDDANYANSAFGAHFSDYHLPNGLTFKDNEVDEKRYTLFMFGTTQFVPASDIDKIYAATVKDNPGRRVVVAAPRDTDVSFTSSYFIQKGYLVTTLDKSRAEHLDCPPDAKAASATAPTTLVTGAHGFVPLHSGAILQPINIDGKAGTALQKSAFVFGNEFVAHIDQGSAHAWVGKDGTQYYKAAAVVIASKEVMLKKKNTHDPKHPTAPNDPNVPSYPEIETRESDPRHPEVEIHRTVSKAADYQNPNTYYSCLKHSDEQAGCVFLVATPSSPGSPFGVVVGLITNRPEVCKETQPEIPVTTTGGTGGGGGGDDNSGGDNKQGGGGNTYNNQTDCSEASPDDRPECDDISISFTPPPYFPPLGGGGWGIPPIDECFKHGVDICKPPPGCIVKGIDICKMPPPPPPPPPTGAVPEPATWAMMLAGFGLLGATMRVKRSRARKLVSKRNEELAA